MKNYEESWNTLSEGLGAANLETFGIDKTRKNSTRKHSFTPEESMRLMRLYQVEALADALGEVHKEDGTPITPYSDFLEGFRFHPSDFSDEELAAIREEWEIGENDDIPDKAFIEKIHHANNDLVGEALHNLEAGLKDTSDIIRGHTYVITQQGQNERVISNWSPYQLSLIHI